MEKGIRSQEKEIYVSPDLLVVEIETEQNILSGSNGTADQNQSTNNWDFGAEEW